MATDHERLRREIVERCRELNANGLNQGTSGNISARCDEGLLISPSGVPYDRLTPDMVVAMDMDGGWEGPLRPSSEWRFHRDILRQRPDVGAVIHAHPPYATALAIRRLDIPALHYMVAVAGGDSIRCAPYATFGTAELSERALAALEGRSACLLANHGMITTGRNLGHAMWLAVEVETLARQYVLSLQIGGPVLLSDGEMKQVFEKFASYAAGRAGGEEGGSKRT